MSYNLTEWQKFNTLNSRFILGGKILLPYFLTFFPIQRSTGKLLVLLSQNGNAGID